MAKLVGVYGSDDYPLERRQFPLCLDGPRRLIVQFPDMCIGCQGHLVDERDVNNFIKKYKSLTSEEINKASTINRDVIINQLSHNVQCVGCRRSVERLLEEFSKVRHRAMEPLTVSHSEIISIMPDYLSDARAIYSLLHIKGSCTSFEISSKTRKGKRCVLHSIEAHKVKSLWSWQDIWDLASSKCQDEILLVDCKSLHVTVDEYLRKHRFCTDCKNKVTYAFQILTREVDGTSDKGFFPSLYGGIRVCEEEQRHLHVQCDEKFIKSLIERAEPELAGSQREQHAKTLDVAQEEVLTCLGVYLHEQFFRLLQKLKVEEKAWMILYSLSVDALKRNLEASFVKKFGDYSIENIMHELMSGDRLEPSFKRPRRKKKKCKKTEVENMSPTCDEAKPIKEKCSDKSQTKVSTCSDSCSVSSQDTNHNIVLTGSCQCDVSVRHRIPPSVVPQSSTRLKCCTNGTVAGAHGETADVIQCNPCCAPNSTRYALENCNNSVSHISSLSDDRNSCKCCHLGITCIQCHQLSSHKLPTNSASVTAGGRVGDGVGDVGSYCFFDQRSLCSRLSRYSTTLSLQDMLQEDPCSTDEEEGFEIDEEDILRFKADEQRLTTERQQLRQTLRQRFANMQQRCIYPEKQDLLITTCNVNVISSKFAEVSTE